MNTSNSTGKWGPGQELNPWVAYPILIAVLLIVAILVVLGMRPGGLFGSGGMSQAEAMKAMGAAAAGPGKFFSDPKWQKVLQQQHPDRYGEPGTPFHMPGSIAVKSPTSTPTP